MKILAKYIKRNAKTKGEPKHMEGLEVDGYLAQDMSHWIDKHRTENAAWFSLAEEINQFAQEQMLKLDIHNGNYQELLVATAFLRALSMFQGVILMSERGMIFEAGTLLRSQIEAMFVIGAAAKDRAFAHRYILSERAGKLRLMKNLLKSNGEVKEIVDTSISWGEADGLRDSLKTDGISDIQIKDVAVAADCSNWYTAVYTYLSQMVAHPTPLSLDNYLFASDGEDMQEFLWGPDVFGINCILSAAVESVIVALEGVSNVFEKSWSSALNSLHSRLAALSKPEGGFRLGYKTA